MEPKLTVLAKHSKALKIGNEVGYWFYQLSQSDSKYGRSYSVTTLLNGRPVLQLSRFYSRLSAAKKYYNGKVPSEFQIN